MYLHTLRALDDLVDQMAVSLVAIVHEMLAGDEN